jgi:hypothetical protein
MITDRTELRGFSGSLAAIDGRIAHELSSALAFAPPLSRISFLYAFLPLGAASAAVTAEGLRRRDTGRDAAELFSFSRDAVERKLSTDRQGLT